MATEVEKLLVRLEVSQNRFEKQLAASARAADQAANKIEKRFAGMNQHLSASFKSLGSGLAAGLAGAVGGLGSSQIISTMRATATEVANIGSEAERAGISSKAFQELGYVAQQNRIPIDALIDGMKELSLRTDELIQTGAGPAAESFHRLGLTAEDLKEQLKKPDELLLTIIGRMEKLDKASQIRIADELFGGTGGERFVELLDTGAQGIRDLQKEANSLGLIMDDQMIAKAGEVDRQFNIVTNTVGTYLKGAIVNAASALSTFIDSFNNFQNQQAQTLRGGIETNFQKQAAKRQEIDDLQKAKGGLLGGLVSGNIDRNIASAREEIAALEAEYGQMQSALDKQVLYKPGLKFGPEPEKPSTLNDKPFNAGGGKAKKEPRDAAAEKAKREAEAMAELIAELEREQGLISATDTERAISNALRQAGATATDAQKAKIRELVTAIEAETAANDRLKDAQEGMKETATDVLHTIADGLRNSASAGEIVGDVLDNLADKLIDMAINNLVENAFPSGKGGGGGGILGGIGKLFGFANGGIAARGKPIPTFAGGGVSKTASIFGEAGPEAAVPLPDGRRIPVDLKMPARGSARAGGGQVFNIDARGAQQGVGEEIRRALAEYDRGSRARTIAAYNEAKRRGNIR